MAEERERRGVGDPNRQTVAKYLSAYVAHLEARGDHAPTTLHSYARNADIAAHHIGEMPLEKVTPLDLDRLYATLLAKGGTPRQDGKPPRPLSKQSALHVHRFLHTALKQAVRWRLIATNPAADATPPSVPFKQARGYTKDEIARLMAAAQGDPEAYCAMAILLTTGLRRSELLGLALDAIDLDEGLLSVRRVVVEVRSTAILRDVPKSKTSRRTMSLPPAVVTLIRQQKARVLEQALAWGEEYSREPMFLFPGLAGVPMLPQSMTLRLRQFRRQAKIEGVAPTHGWRHSAATLLIADGADVKTTQSRLGHSTPVITLRLYADKVDERDRAAGDTLAAYLPATTAT